MTTTDSNDGLDASGGPIGPRPVRVIVVGRTALAGVDAALRTDRTIELIRARSPLAAIGEASSPIDETSPEDLTVIVSPDAIDAARTELFARGIRRVDDSARLLCLGNRVLDGFDARLIAGSQESLRDQVRHAEHHPSAASSVELPVELPLPDEPSAATGAEPPASQQAAAPGLVSPAIALATGHDPIAAALESLKQRWNLSHASIVPVASGDPAPDPATAGATPVIFNGRVLAHLHAQPALPTDAGIREAETIAPWIVLARQQDQLRHAAFTDELTGAWNRRYFNRFLGAAIVDAADKRHTVTLLVFDIDNFKSYNDRFGHAAGDEILVETVRLLNHSIRATDRVCRIGGDEFAVIFHDPTGPRGGAGGPTSPQSIADVVRRFQKAICEHRFPKLSELAPGTLTVSGGLASFPWDGRTVQQLLDRADDLSMHSKQQGKNKITFGPGAAQVCGA